MESHHDERRGARRYELDLAVKLDRRPAESRNISATGLYVLTSRRFSSGSVVGLEVSVPGLRGGLSSVRGTGRVKRVQEDGGKLGVAIEFEGWSFA